MSPLVVGGYTPWYPTPEQWAEYHRFVFWYGWTIGPLLVLGVLWLVWAIRRDCRSGWPGR